jgi:FixJ family two-component response regulator
MSTQAGMIYLVDADPRERESLAMLLASLSMSVAGFGSMAACLAHSRSDLPACLIVDMRLPAVIFLCERTDIRCAVRAMKAGAIDVLMKPLDRMALVRAIGDGLAADLRLRQRREEQEKLQARFSSLTNRERQVLRLIVSGLLNKQAASELGIAEVTLHVHRGQIMRKTCAGSFADLVRMTDRLGLNESPVRFARPADNLMNVSDAAAGTGSIAVGVWGHAS